MKRTIKTIITIVTLCIISIGAYTLGTTQAEKATKRQTVSEVKETTPQTTSFPQQRIMAGDYHDYMVIKTVDGNDWLLDDAKGSPYIKNSISVFAEMELVQVVFDTMGTETVTDDVIISVRSIDRRYKQCNDKH